jgi:hypothetical protein
MKTALLLSLGLLTAPADAGTMGKDRSDAWYREKSDGDLVYYEPYGRVPSTEEQTRCKQDGGKVQQPSDKAPAKEERTPAK